MVILRELQLSLVHGVRIFERPKAPLGMLISLGVLSATLVGAGLLLAIDPKLFARVYRRFYTADEFAKTPEWERKTLGIEGRIFGGVLASFGVGAIYLMLKLFGIISP